MFRKFLIFSFLLCSSNYAIAQFFKSPIFWAPYTTISYGNGFEEDGTFVQDAVGSMGLGAGAKLFLTKRDQRFRASIGLGLQIVGFATRSTRNEPHTDPDALAIYGQPPYIYRKRSYFFYSVIPFEFTYDFSKNWYTGIGLSVNIPFMERGKVVSRNELRAFDFRYKAIKFRPFTTNLGASILMGKRFQMKGGLTVFIEGEIKGYRLVAHRDYDYNFSYDAEYPFTIGINTGVQF